MIISKKQINSFDYFFLTFLHIGKIKYAPGTFVSIFIMLILFVFPINQAYLLYSFLIIYFFSSYLCYKYFRDSLDSDPQYIVIDEVLGMMITLIFIPKNIEYFILAFALFRFFDIFKPSLINRSEKIKYGQGILMDDIISGLITLFIILNIVNI